MPDRMKICYPDWYLDYYGPEDQFAQDQPDEYDDADDFDDDYDIDEEDFEGSARFTVLIDEA